MAETEWILSQFGDNLKHARRKYTEFVLDVRFLGVQKEFHSGESDTRILDDDHFLEQVLDQSVLYKQSLPLFQSVVSEICKTYGHREQDLKALGRNRIMAEARHLVGLVTVRLGIVPLTSVTSFFWPGCVNTEYRHKTLDDKDQGKR